MRDGSSNCSTLVVAVGDGDRDGIELLTSRSVFMASRDKMASKSKLELFVGALVAVVVVLLETIVSVLLASPAGMICGLAVLLVSFSTMLLLCSV